MNYFIISTVVLLIVVILLIFLLIRSKSNSKENRIHIRSLEKELEGKTYAYNDALEGLKFIGYLLGHSPIGACNDKFYRTFRVQKTKGICIRQISGKGERKIGSGKLAFLIGSGKYLDIDSIAAIIIKYTDNKANRTKSIKTQIFNEAIRLKK